MLNLAGGKMDAASQKRKIFPYIELWGTPQRALRVGDGGWED